MKKIFSMMLVVFMLVAPLCLATSADTTADYGTLFFEEDFSDASKAATYFAAALGGNIPDGKTIDAFNRDSYFKIEDGKLKVSLASISTKGTMRFKLCDIPADATEYTIVVECKTTDSNSSDATRNTMGILLKDNGVNNWDPAKGDFTSDVPGKFQFFWGRPQSTTGVTRYGDGTSAKKVYAGSIYQNNVDYIITIIVNNKTNLGEFLVVEKGSGFTVGYAAFDLEQGLPSVAGLVFNGTVSEVDSFKVYTKTAADTPATEAATEAATDAATNNDTPATQAGTQAPVATRGPEGTRAPVAVDDEESSNLGLIIAIVAVAVVAVVVVVVVVLKKKKAK